MLKSSLKYLVLFLPVFLFLNFFVFSFISREKFLYFWDYAGYWDKYQTLGLLLKSDPMPALTLVVSSMQNEDYNFLTAFILQPFYFFFGGSRLSYILALTNLFLIPALLLFNLLIVKLARRAFQTNSLLQINFFSTALFLSLGMILVPLLLGYVDIAGLILIFTIYILFFHQQFEEISLLRSLILGSLLALLIVLRRPFIFWSMAFLLLITAEIFLKLFYQEKDFINHGLKLITKFVFIITSFGATLLFLSTSLIHKIFSVNYNFLYAAYKGEEGVAEYIRNGQRLFNFSGLIIIFLFISSLFFLLIRGKMRRIGFYLAGQFIIIFILFSQTQDFTIHHFYLLTPSIIISISLFLIYLSQKLKNTLAKTLYTLTILSVLVLIFTATFYPDFNKNIKAQPPLFPSLVHKPLTRNDLPEINRIVLTLNGLVQESDFIYVLSSSSVFSDEILKQACTGRCGQILPTSHVDNRDGFPTQFYKADFVLVADPIQYHLKPENQKVIGILAQQFLKNENQNFEKLDQEFHLEKDVKVYIYKKRALDNF